MPEIWLRSNSRVSLLGLIVSALLCCAGGWLLLFTGIWRELGKVVTTWGMLVALLGIGLVIAGFILAWLAAWFWRRPRVACDGLVVEVNLGGLSPARLPVEVVECFFIGQGPAMIRAEEKQDAQAANVIVRLAEKAAAWRSGPAQPALGKWSDSYITIRGAWCEPIDGDLVNRMNAQLAEVHRLRRQAAQTEVA